MKREGFLIEKTARITVVAPSRAMAVLHELLECYRQNYDVTLVQYENVLDKKALYRLCDDTDAHAVLYVTNRRYSPRTLLDGPVITSKSGRKIVVGMIPYVNDKDLATFATAASKSHRRHSHKTKSTLPKSVVILSQWSRRYLRLADSLEASLQGDQGHENTAQSYRWTSDHLVREDMVDGLNAGFSMAVYLGHGRSTGWVGYRGTRTHHFQNANKEWDEPLGALFSLSCENASRKNTGLSFAESLPLLGVCAASIGAVGKTQHIDNMRWALSIGRAISGGANSVDQVIRSLPCEAKSSLNIYRVIGDPIAPLTAHPQADKRARTLMSNERKYG
ncbi:MAG: hypothetical protein JKY01_06465 [Pseudomonadales bacterium]|nr:hypothetical protein [Pseudomonadales bacterium]